MNVIGMFNGSASLECEEASANDIERLTALPGQFMNDKRTLSFVRSQQTGAQLPPPSSIPGWLIEDRIQSIRRTSTFRGPTRYQQSGS